MVWCCISFYVRKAFRGLEPGLNVATDITTFMSSRIEYMTLDTNLQYYVYFFLPEDITK